MHILWVHNSSSILLSQTFEFLNTSANYKDATGNMFVNAYWSWSPIYFLRLWRVWVVYIYIHLISYIVFCLFVSVVYHQKNIAVRGTCCGKTASQFADLLTNMLRTYHRKIWMVCYVAMCLVTVFLFQNCLLTHTNASSRNPPKKHQKVFVPKAHCIAMTLKRSSVSQNKSNKKITTSWLPATSLVYFLKPKNSSKPASTEIASCFLLLKRRIPFICQRSSTLVIHPPW